MTSKILPLASILALTTMAGAQTVTVEKIPGGLTAMDMSPDGRWVVGLADQNGDGFGDGLYRYDLHNDVFLLLPPEGLSASAVSDDGSVVLGSMADPDDGVEVAGIWTAETGWVSIGWLPDALNCPSRSNGYELSADGTVAVGLSWDGCSGRGFVWTEETGMLELEPQANGGNRASVCSADGSVIGGFAQGSFSRTPASWDGVSTDGTLLDPPNGDAVGEVMGISDDGGQLFGYWEDDAFMYTDQNGVEVLGSGSISPGWIGYAMDIANNGMIVGFDGMFQSRRGWVQPTRKDPLQAIDTWAVNNGATIPPGLTLDIAMRISSDGGTIVGHSFFQAAWVVKIDTPTCSGDLDGNGSVGINDLLTLLGTWGTDGTGADIAEPTDIVDISDLLGMLGAWGDCD